MKHASTFFLYIVLWTMVSGLLQAQEPNSAVQSLDPSLNAIVSPSAKLEKLTDGLGFAEGPVWVRQGSEGFLLFSDISANAIRKWTPDGKLSIFLQPSGYTGKEDPAAAGIGALSNNGKQEVILIGSNGVTVDPQGRVVFVTHGDRNVVRIEKDGKRTVLADRYQGKRLSSPNDLVYKSDGALYFSDNTAGMRERDKDPKKELPFLAFYRLKDDKLEIAAQDVAVPNGLAFSPDEKVFYATGRNAQGGAVIWRYDVKPDGTLANGKMFVDMSKNPSPGTADGMKVDTRGNLWATGPGGLWIISPDGKHLGTIRTPEPAANVAFGGRDMKDVFITARTGLYRIRALVAGIGAQR